MRYAERLSRQGYIMELEIQTTILQCLGNREYQNAFEWPTSASSNCARARLISSCMNKSSSIRASILASAGLDSARRKSSTDNRVFFDGPPAVWHCYALKTGLQGGWHGIHTTSMMNSIKISSITLTVSLPGFLSSPKPYIRFFTRNRHRKHN